MAEVRWGLNDPVVDPATQQWGANDPVVTPEEIESRNKPASTWLGRRMQDVGALYESAFPDRDPRYADLPGFTGTRLSLEDFAEVNRAKLSAAGFEDEAWKRRVLEIIGPNRFLELKKDSQGNDIVRFRGDDGKEYERYINRPGLDWEDVDRTIDASIPYVVGGGVAGRATRGLGLLGRAGAQGVTAGVVSAGQDVGAGQPVELGKAGAAATFGAAGEVAGTVIPRIWRALFTPRYWDEAAGTLTEAGRKEAARLGLDPDQVQGEVGRRLADIRRAPDPRAAASGVEAGDFGIPTTRGQRTKDPDQLLTEEQMRRSLLGPAARDVITDFDRQQAEAITRAAGEVRQRVAPQGAERIAEAGQGITQGLTSARKAADKRISEAWDAVTEVTPITSKSKKGDLARAALTTRLRDSFDDLGFFPDAELTPQAHRMMQAIEGYSKGLPPRLPYKILGKPVPRAPAVDAQRRRLLKLYENATTPQDRAASRAVYEAFNDWTDDLAKGRMLRTPEGGLADETVMEPFKAARKITREQRARFEPKDRRGRLLPGGKLLQQLSESGDSPERVAGILFGAGTGTAPKAGTVLAVTRLKDVLDPVQFDQVKALYFLRMITGRNGEMLSPGRMNSSIKQAFANQKSVVEKLFGPEDRQFINRFRKAVETTTFTPPNPSGTSYALERFRQHRKDDPIKFLLRRMGTRATFQGNTFAGGMYGWLARALPDVAGVQSYASRKLAGKAIRQGIEERADSGSLLAAIAAAHEAREEGNR